MISLWKFATVLSLVAVAVGQSSNVTCLSTYEWTFNSKGQSPCLVSAYLQSVCTRTAYSINTIPLGTHYVGPTLAQATLCNCNTVVYSLTSACGTCQGRFAQSWTTWAINCPDAAQTIAGFPRPIPDDTEVPRWAYLNVTESVGQVWNPVEARIVADQPEGSSSTSQSPGPTTSLRSSNPPSSSANPGTQTPTSNPAQNPSSSSGGSNAGAIAGGVVGGLAFLIALGLVVLWFVLRKKRKAQTAPPKGFVIDTSATNGKVSLASSPPPLSRRTVVSPGLSYIDHDSLDAGRMAGPISQATPSVIQTTITTRRSQESFSVSQFGTHVPRSAVGYTGAAEV